MCLREGETGHGIPASGTCGREAAPGGSTPWPEPGARAHSPLRRPSPSPRFLDYEPPLHRQAELSWFQEQMYPDLNWRLSSVFSETTYQSTFDGRVRYSNNARNQTLSSLLICTLPMPELSVQVCICLNKIARNM